MDSLPCVIPIEEAYAIFTVQLSEPLDKEAFLAPWKIDAERNAAPRVDFDFRPDRHVSIRIHTLPDTPWTPDSFERAFAISVHRIAPWCEITWLKNV